MNSAERRSVIVHDLLHIQQKRMIAYEKALKECCPQDGGVCDLLRGMVEHSRQSITELRCYTSQENSEPADRCEIRGEIYREWPELNYFTPGNTMHEIVLCCEYIEKTTSQAYHRALQNEQVFDRELRQLLYLHWLQAKASFESVYAHLGRPSAPEVMHEERMPGGLTREGIFASV